MTANPVRATTVRRRFARARQAAGYTQETLAAHLSVERSTVGRWELGETEPHAYVRPKLAGALNLSPEVLEALLADTTDDRPAWAIRLQAEREARGWSKREMARRLFAAISVSDGSISSMVRQIRGWELGDHFPRDWHAAYTIAFGVDQLELFGQIDFQTGRRLVTLDPLPNGEKEGDVERRKLLENLAILGVAVSPAGQALGEICASVEHAFSSSQAHQVEHWEGIVNEYGYSYITRPPQQLIADLAADLTTLRLVTKDLDRDASIYKDWCRIGSMLAGLMAKALSNLSHTREARHWWQTAQIAGDSSGDLEVRLWVRGERLIHGLYEQRSPHLVLRQSTDALELAKGHICAGLLSTSAARAQSLALAGIHDAAEAELARTANIFEQLPSATTSDIHSVFGQGVDRLHYTQTWAHAFSGNTARTDRAAELALSCYPATNHRTPAQVKLIQAFARIRSGDITEGLKTAHVTFEALAPSQRTTMVTDLASRALESIPSAKQRRADVNAYRELLATTGAKPHAAISS